MEKITEKEEKEIDQRWKEPFRQARQNFDRENYEYASSILERILGTEPGYTDARILLHHTRFAQSQQKSELFRQSIGMLAACLLYYVLSPLYFKKGRYTAAVKKAEKMMAFDGRNPLILVVLGQALKKAGALNCARSTMEMASRVHQEHFDILKTLADVYGASGMYPQQRETLEKLRTIRPEDRQLQEELARVAMHEGKWEDATSYRDVVKDKEKAHTLEQRERRAPRDEESLNTLIEDAEAQLAESDNIGNRKRLADLYHRKKDYDKALEQYQEALNKSRGGDPTIEKTMNDIQCEKYDVSIREWQEYAENNPDEKAQADEKIQELEAEKLQLRREYLEEMVKRYPNEPEYHYNLGQFYWNQGEFDNALKEFQQASATPRLRRDSLMYIGHCMIAKNMYDLAIEQFETVLNEMPERMDKHRKEVVYNLAWAHEQKGNEDNAARYYKEIYKVDAAYRDVNEKLEALYQQ